MQTSNHQRLPLAPLLHAYASRMPGPGDPGRLPGVGPRFAAIQGATARFLFADFVDTAADAEFAEALAKFYDACVDPPVHAATILRKAGLVRHGLAHLLRGCDSLAKKANAYLSTSGAYHVHGLGPTFWTALFQALDTEHNPWWTREAVVALQRLGLTRSTAGSAPEVVYGELQAAFARIRTAMPSLSALHVNHFLTRVVGMVGRDLWAAEGARDAIADVIAQLRQQIPVRDRVKERGAVLQAARAQLASALACQDGDAVLAVLAAAVPNGGVRSTPLAPADKVTLAERVARLWQSDDVDASLAEWWQTEPPPGAGLWVAPALLHLRDPGRFLPWTDDLLRGHASLSDAAGHGAPQQRYALLNEVGAWLRERYQLHPFEVAAVLSRLGKESAPAAAEPASGPRGGRAEFHGFCDDSFAFLAELARNNCREWMEPRRARYRFAVREPLVELCRTLAARFVTPVLRDACGWDLDVEARSGHALTSICKNAFGRAGPYNSALWVTYCSRRAGGPRASAQMFVRVGPEGIRFGLRIGKGARDALARLRRNVEGHADLLYRMLRDGGALAECRFGPADLWEAGVDVASAADLSTHVVGRSFEASRFVPATADLATRDELAGEVLLTFDRLLPLFACAMEGDAGSFLLRRSGAADERFTEVDFRRNTWLGDAWLDRARGLLQLKRQLILQGVPGTGKTHVARCLARLLTGGRSDAVRLVQFHPAYSYEEFVEGIKARSVDVGGRHEVTYPVEAGLLCEFAALAERRPSEPFVLIIDEINRGNLPRIFGELLYLLEYRGQSVDLPYSRRPFRLPANLTLIGTMNAADRSVAQIDRALRRRFSFLEMPPDAAVLAAWFAAREPVGDAALAERVINLFTRLNCQLRDDLGVQAQVGHSYFMVPGLDEAKLRVVWHHHVRPLLEEYFVGQPNRLEAYDLDTLLEDAPRRRVRSGPAKAAGVIEPDAPDHLPSKPR